MSDPCNKTTKFKVGDRVRLTKDFGTSMAVPVGREGRVIEVGMWGSHIVVDFGHPWCERGCRDGEYLELVNG